MRYVSQLHYSLPIQFIQVIHSIIKQPISLYYCNCFNMYQVTVKQNQLNISCLLALRVDSTIGGMKNRGWLPPGPISAVASPAWPGNAVRARARA
jgi:hypothetical protein